ncbi:hypothetical protein FIBSPDRAFT_866772 [Athelia psychrophila]|uniref:Uncharacterized protein n=1 Tax=Athelia psychrophila TaxID=1759441 RepID=A0A166EEH5_9AGAM|nr:hypothetical protein FIBSPDRAFT_866772 [Fibularhizoctonia sp. CBS 109695]
MASSAAQGEARRRVQKKNAFDAGLVWEPRTCCSHDGEEGGAAETDDKALILNQLAIGGCAEGAKVKAR